MEPMTVLETSFPLRARRSRGLTLASGGQHVVDEALASTCDDQPGRPSRECFNQVGQGGRAGDAGRASPRANPAHLPPQRTKRAKPQRPRRMHDPTAPMLSAACT